MRRLLLNRTAADAAAFAVILAVGLAGVANPFTGDQALFNVAASALDDGAVYYRDFWDIKQPGIFWFYLAGGRLFGFDATGIHLFELLYMLAFAVVLRIALGDRFRHRWLATVAPVAVVGGYFALARPVEQTQIEGLVGFPLFVVLWTALRAADRPERRALLMLASGVVAGLVLVMKLVLAPLVAAFWLVAMIRMARGPAGGRGIALPLLAAVVGASVPVLAAVAYFARHDVLDLAVRTTFVYPPQVTQLPGMHSPELLARLAGSTVLNYGLFLAAAAVGLVLVPVRRWSALTTGLVAWVGVGALVVVVQRWSIYQRQLVLVPLVLLALQGVDRGIDWWQSSGRHRLGPAWAKVGAAAAVLALVAGAAYFPARKAVTLAAHGLALTDDDRQAYRRASYGPFRDVGSAVGEVAPLPGDGAPIYVMGDPLFYELLDRGQAIPINGWAPQQWLDEQWADVRGQLARAQPRFLFVDGFSADVASERSPELLELIDQRYGVFHRYREGSPVGGTWYQLRSSGERAE